VNGEGVIGGAAVDGGVGRDVAEGAAVGVEGRGEDTGGEWVRVVKRGRRKRSGSPRPSGTEGERGGRVEPTVFQRGSAVRGGGRRVDGVGGHGGGRGDSVGGGLEGRGPGYRRGVVSEDWEFFVVGDSHTRRSKGFLLKMLPPEVQRRTTIVGVGGAGVENIAKTMRELRDRRGGWKNAVWIIQGGVNDLARGKRFRDVKKDLSGLMQEVEAGDGEVAICPLVAIRGLEKRTVQWNFEFWRDLVEGRIRRMAINGHREWVGGGWNGVHLDERGYVDWASGIAESIQHCDTYFRQNFH
jgi:lysophospholipase L1-like esterase